MENKGLYVTWAPHLKKAKSINSILMDMVIAFIPVIAAAVYLYGIDAMKILTATVAASVASEMLWNKFILKKQWLTDISSVVTGLTIGLIMPAHLPIWIVVIGAIFAIIFVKMFFGGLGQNIMNLAATTKAFLIASFASVMAAPVISDGVSNVANTPSLLENLVLRSSLSIGEASILGILLGGLYLAYRGVISLRAPIAFLVSAFMMYYLLGEFTLISGSFFFAAIFLSTEYATTPMTKSGQYIFGILSGILASVIAIIANNPEGPYYAIIIINLLTPIIEHYTIKRVKIKEVA